MKIRYILLVLLLSSLGSMAQQIPHYSQFWFNDFGTNPAFAGTKPHYQARSSNRYQWVGVTDAPRTFMLSANGPERKKDMGYGVQLFSDVTAATSRLGIYGSYAYNFKLNKDIKISMGLTIGMLQYKIDGSQIDLNDDNDPTIGDEVMAAFMPDADFGFLMYGDKWSFGLVGKQLFNNKMEFDEVTTLGMNALKTHLFIHGSYEFEINKMWSVEPFALVKYLNPLPIQADLGFRGIWKKMVWLGASWRSADAISIMIGYEHQEKLSFGYSYDVTTSNLSHASSGTHELMIGFRFSNIKKKESYKF